METQKKLKIREKVAYGVGDMGNNIAYGAVGFYFLFFLTDVAGISPLWAGAIFMIIRLWNAFSDLFVGIISDRTRSKWGRRRPYLLFGAIPLGISFALLWMIPFENKTELVIYYAVAGIIFNTLYSVVAIPYNALLPDLSQDYHERTSISGYKMAFSFVGSLLSAMGVMLIVDTLFPGRSHYLESYPYMGKMLGCILMVCILISFMGTRERVGSTNVSRVNTQKGLWNQFKSLAKLKAYRWVLGLFIFNMVGFDIIMALYIYFMKYALLISEDLSYVFMAIPLVSAVIFTPMWVKISDKIGKEKTYIVSAIYFMVPLISCIFIPSEQLLLTGIVTVLIGVGISASQILIFSILPDVVEVDEEVNGVRREGVIYGVTMLIYKMSSAVLVGLTTASLGWIGYVESKSGELLAQSQSAIVGIRVLMGCLPAFFLLLSIICVHQLKKASSSKHSTDMSRK